MQGTNVFAGKHGYITPRDLFRWGNRAAVGYQQVTLEGAARVTHAALLLHRISCSTIPD